MKAFILSLTFASLIPLSAQADFTIVQKVENKGQASEMTLKVKGERVRMEATPEMTMIVEGKTGNMVTLINAQKKFMRISGDKAKAIAEMAAKYGATTTEKPKLVVTGKKNDDQRIRSGGVRRGNSQVQGELLDRPEVSGFRRDSETTSGGDSDCVE